MEELQNNKNIYTALSKAQGEIKGAAKSADNPFFKSKFADLSEVLAVIQEPAAKNGLSTLFNVKTEIIGENPVFWIQYHLNHSSGESIKSDWVIMLMAKKDAHGFGAALTYFKRQLLKMIYQISEVDDDANSIVDHSSGKNFSYNEPKTFQNNTQASQNKAPIRVPVTK